MYVWVGMGAREDSKSNIQGKGLGFNQMLHWAFS